MWREKKYDKWKKLVEWKIFKKREKSDFDEWKKLLKKRCLSEKCLGKSENEFLVSEKWRLMNENIVTREKVIWSDTILMHDYWFLEFGKMLAKKIVWDCFFWWVKKPVFWWVMHIHYCFRKQSFTVFAVIQDSVWNKLGLKSASRQLIDTNVVYSSAQCCIKASHIRSVM